MSCYFWSVPSISSLQEGNLEGQPTFEVATLPARFPQQAHFTDEKPEALRIKYPVQGHTAGKRNRQHPAPGSLAPLPLSSRVGADLWGGRLTAVLSLIGENWEVTAEEKG